MSFLLFVTAALVAASSLIKLRSTSRVGLGLRPLALLELLAGLALAVLVLPGPLSGTSVVRWAVPVAIGLVLVSSLDHAFRLRAYRRARADSEGGRLAAYVKYLADAPGETEPEDGPGTRSSDPTE